MQYSHFAAPYFYRIPIPDVLRGFLKVHKLGLISPFFLMADTMTEKAHLLGPIRWNSLTDGTLLTDLMGQLDVTRERWSLM